MDIIGAAAPGADIAQVQAHIHQVYVQRVEHRPHFLFRLQATAAAASDPDIAEEVRRSFIEGFDRLLELCENDRQAVKDYIAIGVFSDVAMAISLPRAYWPALPAG